MHPTGMHSCLCNVGLLLLACFNAKLICLIETRKFTGII